MSPFFLIIHNSSSQIVGCDRIVFHLGFSHCLRLFLLSEYILHSATHTPFTLLCISLSVTRFFVLKIQTRAQQHSCNTQNNEDEYYNVVSGDERLGTHQYCRKVCSLIRLR